MIPLEPHYETVFFTRDNGIRDMKSQDSNSQNEVPQDSEIIYGDTSGDALPDKRTTDGKTLSDGSLEHGTTNRETSDDGTWQISFDWYEKDGTLYTNAKNMTLLPLWSGVFLPLRTIPNFSS